LREGLRESGVLAGVEDNSLIALVNIVEEEPHDRGPGWSVLTKTFASNGWPCFTFDGGDLLHGHVACVRCPSARRRAGTEANADCLRAEASPSFHCRRKA
jgi:hypothetical protein